MDFIRVFRLCGQAFKSSGVCRFGALCLKVSGLGFRVQGLGFRVEGLGFQV